jgi:hypothetical protein
MNEICGGTRGMGAAACSYRKRYSRSMVSAKLASSQVINKLLG